MIHVELLVGAVPTNILGFNLLYGRTWKLPEGSVQSFAGQGDEEIEWFNEDEPNSINLLEISIPLSPSKIINVIRYPLLAAVHLGIDGVVSDFEKRGIITHMHSPYNSPVWTVKKLNGW